MALFQSIRRPVRQLETEARDGRPAVCPMSPSSINRMVSTVYLATFTRYLAMFTRYLATFTSYLAMFTRYLATFTRFHGVPSNVQSFPRST